MCPAKINQGDERGYVIPIGGAEDRSNNPTILQRIVKMAGGKKAKIAILPTASQREETGEEYEKVFKALGAGEAFSLHIDARQATHSEDNLARLETSTMIFMTGGNQLRLSTIIGGTPFAQAIRRLNARGVHVAGTSAGAAIMPEHMIAGGPTGALPNEQGVTLAPGLGLINKIILDQHFSQRNRLGRLLSAVAYNPFASAIGICEDTAAFIAPSGLVEVEGSGSLTIIDPSEMQHSSMAYARRGETITMLGLKLHMLSAGSGYHLHTREAFPTLVTPQASSKKGKKPLTR